MTHLRNGQFGRYTTLKEITTIDNTNNNNTKPKVPRTRIIRISEHTYRMMVGHSKRFYDVECYDTILENLLKCYEEHNEDTRWYHNTS